MKIQKKRAETELSFDRRLVFIKKDQTKFEPADIESRKIDFVFFDASHDLDLNKTTFKKIQSSLAPGAMIAVHDTGVWNKDFFSEIHNNFASNSHNGIWITDKQYAHQPEERTFVDWVVSENQGFCSIHLHSLATLRHGLSLIQHSAKLSSQKG